MQRGAARRPPAVDVVEQQHVVARHDRTVEHVVDRADIVLVDARQAIDMRQHTLETFARRRRASRQHDHIGARRHDILGAHLGAQLDAHLQLLELGLEPGQELADLATLGLAGGEGGTGRPARRRSRRASRDVPARRRPARSPCHRARRRRPARRAASRRPAAHHRPTRTRGRPTGWRGTRSSSRACAARDTTDCS